jgi:hypothetical protein
MLYIVTWSSGLQGYYMDFNDALRAAKSYGMESTIHKQSTLVAQYTFFGGMKIFNKNKYI